MGTTRALAAVLSLLLIAPCSAQGTGTYHRFYQGYLVTGLTESAFHEATNRDFLPLFLPAHAHGLTAYRPALVRAPASCKLPAWIALLTFESEPVYTAYTQSEAGKKIRAAHAPVFDAQTSGKMDDRAALVENASLDQAARILTAFLDDVASGKVSVRN